MPRRNVLMYDAMDPFKPLPEEIQPGNVQCDAKSIYEIPHRHSFYQQKWLVIAFEDILCRFPYLLFPEKVAETDT